ncbi:MAG: hypothetical protein HQ541_13505, partial [Mariniphaga sp.]|nr:hypothetical protein [Mariniphaga sp.]
MKRILIISLIVIIGLAVGYYFLTEQKINFSGETSEFSAVPIDAPVFVRFASVKDFPVNNEVISGLYKAGIFNSLVNFISGVDSLIKGSETLGKSLKNHPFIIVLNLEGREEITPIIITKAESSKKKKELENVISILFPADTYRYEKRQYNGEKINDISHIQSKETFSYSFTNGLLIVGSRVIMVEKSIRQLDTESLPDNKIFRKVHKTATQQAKAAIYINHQYFPDLIKIWIDGATKRTDNEFGEEKRINYKNNLAAFSNYSAWSELDLSIKANELRLNGVSIAPDSLNQYLTVFRNQEPVRIKIDKIMPRNTAMYYNIAFSNKKGFFEDLNEYFIHSNGFYEREEKLKLINSTARADLKPVFEELVEDEVAMAFSNISDKPAQKNVFFIVSVKANSKAKEELLAWLEKYTLRKNLDFGQLTSKYEIDTETTFDIYKFPYPSFPGIWLGEPFSAASANYFTFWNNYIVFANTLVSLENLLHDLTLEANLADDPNYLRFKDKIENKANINFFLDINNGYNLNLQYFDSDIAKIFKENEEELRKFSAINWQVLSSNNIFFNNILLNYSEEIIENAKTTWQSNIGANTYLKPQFVVNHNDPENKEIIVQDNLNLLHLITKEGRVRWGIKIPGKILGKIHQIDYLRNGRLQFLFNTKDKIYLIDREGNNVSPFPVALRSPATNGLNVFDYDNNRKYRYFIAGEDKKVYAYDGSGNIVSGWKFGQTDHEVKTPVQHFRVGGKDYIVFKDKSKIYVQDRQGNTRVDLQSRFENSQNPIILNLQGTPKMVATDISGSVYYLYFDGKFLKKETSGFSQNHLFNVDDINV